MDELSKRSYDSLRAESEYRKDWLRIFPIICFIAILFGALPMIVFEKLADELDEDILRFLNFLAPVYRIEQFVTGLASGYVERTAAALIGVVSVSLLAAVSMAAAVLLLRALTRRPNQNRRNRSPSRPGERKRDTPPGTVSVAAEKAASIAAAHAPAPLNQPVDKTQDFWSAKAKLINWDTTPDSQPNTPVEPVSEMTDETSLPTLRGKTRSDTVTPWKDVWKKNNMLDGEIRKPGDGGNSDYLSILKPAPPTNGEDAREMTLDELHDLMSKSAPPTNKEETIPVKPGDSGADVQVSKPLSGLTQEAKLKVEAHMAELQKTMKAVSFDRSCIRIQTFGNDNRVTDEVYMLNADGKLQYDLNVDCNIQTVEFRQHGSECNVCFTNKEGNPVHRPLVWNRPIPFSFRDMQNPSCVLTWFGGGRK